jgi:uncharacterized protein
MSTKNLFLLFILIFVIDSAVLAQDTANLSNSKKVSILVHITHGPENPTRAALGFLVAKTAIEEGHTVTLFLAGDAVKLLQDSVLNNLTGIGTGKLRDHYEAIVKGNGKFYLSGNSSKARGVTEADIKGKPAEFALPQVLVRLSVNSDRMFTY